MTTDTVTPNNTQRIVTDNAYDPGFYKEGAFHLQRTTAQVLATGGTLAAAFFIGNVPGLLIATGALATTAAAGRIGRNQDVRTRPLIESKTHIERIGERIVYRLGEKESPKRVWRATEFELSQYDNDKVSPFTLGIRQSWPVKAAYTYPRLLLAKARDFTVSTYSMLPWGHGVSFNEGVASRRLERAGLITPTPRTQQHIQLARDWYTRKGKTLV